MAVTARMSGCGLVTQCWSHLGAGVGVRKLCFKPLHLINSLDYCSLRFPSTSKDVRMATEGGLDYGIICTWIVTDM